MKTENLTQCMLCEIYLPERHHDIVSGDKVHEKRNKKQI